MAATTTTRRGRGIRKSRKKITLTDIARRANVSVAAVSLALAERPGIGADTRDRIVRLSRELGYVPRHGELPQATARPPVVRGTARMRIALAMVCPPERLELELHWLQFMIRAGEQVNCNFEIDPIHETDLAAQTQRLEDAARGVDGVVLEGYVSPALLEASANLAPPAVLIGNTFGSPLSPPKRGWQVTADMRTMGHLATQHLLKKGHRRIAFLCARVQENLWYEQWLAGYRHAHVDAGVPFDPALALIRFPEMGIQASDAIAAMSDPPTALVFASAAPVWAVLQLMRNKGFEYAPADVVIGGESGEIAQFHVGHHPTVTIDQDLMADECLNLLSNPSHDRKKGLKLVIPFETRNL